MQVDTDGDSLPDKLELTKGLDPLDPADAGADWDGDKLTNAQELSATGQANGLNFLGEYTCVLSSPLPDTYDGVPTPWNPNGDTDPIYSHILLGANASGEILLESYPQSGFPITYKSSKELIEDDDGHLTNFLTFTRVNNWGTDSEFGAWGHFGQSISPSGNVAGVYYQEDGYSAASWRNSSGQWQLPDTLANCCFYPAQRGEEFYFGNWSNPLSTGCFVPPSTRMGTAQPGQVTFMNMNPNYTGNCSTAAGGYFAFSFPSGSGYEVWRGKGTNKEQLNFGSETVGYSVQPNEHGDLAYFGGANFFAGHLYEIPAGKSPQERRDIHPRNYPPYLRWPGIHSYSVNGDVILAGSYNDYQATVVRGKIGSLLSNIYAEAGLDEDRYTLASQALFDEAGNIHFLVFDNDQGLYNHVKLYHRNDADEDGMSDDWERYYFGGLSRNGTDDWDSDGVSDGKEFTLGLDPKEIDTDGDGEPDDKDPDPTNSGVHNPMMIIRSESMHQSGDTPDNYWGDGDGDWSDDMDMFVYINPWNVQPKGTKYIYIEKITTWPQADPYRLDRLAKSEIDLGSGPIVVVPGKKSKDLPIPLDGPSSGQLLAESYWRFTSDGQGLEASGMNVASFIESRIGLKRGNDRPGPILMPEIRRNYLLVETNLDSAGFGIIESSNIESLIEAVIPENKEYGAIPGIFTTTFKTSLFPFLKFEFNMEVDVVMRNMKTLYTVGIVTDLDNDGRITLEDKNRKNSTLEPKEYLFANDDVSNGALYDDDDVEELNIDFPSCIRTGVIKLEYKMTKSLKFYLDRDCTKAFELIDLKTNRCPSRIFMRFEPNVATTDLEFDGELVFKYDNSGSGTLLMDSLKLCCVRKLGSAHHHLAANDYILENNSEYYTNTFGEDHLRYVFMLQKFTKLKMIHAEKDGLRQISRVITSPSHSGATLVVNGTYASEDGSKGDDFWDYHEGLRRIGGVNQSWGTRKESAMAHLCFTDTMIPSQRWECSSGDLDTAPYGGGEEGTGGMRELGKSVYDNQLSWSFLALGSCNNSYTQVRFIFQVINPNDGGSLRVDTEKLVKNGTSTFNPLWLDAGASTARALKKPGGSLIILDQKERHTYSVDFISSLNEHVGLYLSFYSTTPRIP